jgi:hypothetical protein
VHTSFFDLFGIIDMFNRLFVFVFVGLLCCCSGCPQRNPNDTIKVTGNVLVDGVPMPGTLVMFSPQGGAGIGAGGRTDEKGDFVLTTPGSPDGSGAVAGKYDVMFSKYETVDAAPSASLSELDESGGTESVRPKSLINEKYKKATTSGIEPVEVVKGGNNHFEFQLQK